MKQKQSTNSAPHTWLKQSAATVALTVAIALLFGACSDKAPSPAAEERRLLVIDGIEIRFDDLQPYVDFLTEIRPNAGKKTKYIWVMREHVLPLMAARRTFGAERAEQRKLAEGLCSVATNILELEQHTKLMQHKRRSNLTRSSAKLPVAMFLFDIERMGSVSPPIEVPAGYFVVSSFEFFESPLIMAEYVDALQVGFITHTSGDWAKWWQAEQLRIADKITFVHPDYRDNLPPWMQLPKDKKP